MTVTRSAAWTDGLTVVNGEAHALDAALVTARDRGLTLADGLFETMRVRHGRVFQLGAHLNRLERGLAVLRIPLVADMGAAIAGALERFGAADAAVRVTVTRGPGASGLAVPAASTPTVIVTVTPLPSFHAEIYEKGLRAHVPRGRRNPRAATAGVKTLSYTDAIVGLLEAQERGADEALFLDVDEHCSEASASNLFVWTGATLVTPPASCGALPGITRATVMQLATTLGIEAIERPCTIDELLAAEEAFLTSSLRGIAPLVRVDGHAVGPGIPGPLTRRLTAAHAEQLERETTGNEEPN
jgi:branched-chain amino acid aminotransferase